MFYAQRENGWQIDYKKVYELFNTDYEVSVAYYFTGIPYYEKTLEIESYRKFKNFLIRTGYQIVEKEIKRIKRKLPEDVLINGKRLKDIIKKEIQNQKRIPKKIELKNVDIKLYKGEKEKAGLDVNITLHMVAEMSHYDGIIFFGGDSNFEPLLSYLRNNGKYIICVGKK